MLDHAANSQISPHRVFDRSAWAGLRDDAKLTLNAEELIRLQSINDPVSLSEVEDIYLPISKLISSHVETMLRLFNDRREFLNVNVTRKTPFIIGIAGSVSVGKSTTARLLQALLSRWPSSPVVDLVTTDGFLMPNHQLTDRGLMERKGFPESYDVNSLLQFLAQIKGGQTLVRAPVYSHLHYDIIPDEYQIVDAPDILILEGLNVLQTSKLPKDGNAVPFVSDFFDFSIYIDAAEQDLHQWYVERFMRLRETAFRDKESFFTKYADTTKEEAQRIADGLWNRINLVNLRDNIFPTRPRADLIMNKDANHLISHVLLRRL
jgi:type I pantothenate kinase